MRRLGLKIQPFYYKMFIDCGKNRNLTVKKRAALIKTDTVQQLKILYFTA